MSCKHSWTGPHKFKDIVPTEDGFYYTVYIKYCVKCGELSGESWIE